MRPIKFLQSISIILNLGCFTPNYKAWNEKYCGKAAALICGLQNSVIQKMCQSLAFRLRSLWSYALDYTLTSGRVSRRGERPVASFGGKKESPLSPQECSIFSHNKAQLGISPLINIHLRPSGVAPWAQSLVCDVSVVTHRLWHAFLIQTPFLDVLAGGGVSSEVFMCVCDVYMPLCLSESTRDSD